jgi:arylformamidase
MTESSSRRDFFKGSAALGVALTAVHLSAGPARAHGGDGSGGRGPKVYRDYTQTQLDRAYSQDYWVDYSPNQIEPMYEALSAPVTDAYAFTTHVYGDAGRLEELDFFPTAAPDAPIHVFVHGGAWIGLSKESSRLGAPAFVDTGANYVSLGFPGIFDVESLSQMADAVRRAIVWLYRNKAQHGGDTQRIFISGHSSGGHLAAVALTTDWSRYGVPQDVLKGGLCISGLYDLEPVSLSYRNEYLGLTAAEIQELSPIRNIDRVSCPVVVASAENDSPEFARQASDFAAALRRHSAHESHSLVAKGLNHYDISFTLGYADGVMGNAALRMMSLAEPAVLDGPAGPVEITTW